MPTARELFAPLTRNKRQSEELSDVDDSRRVKDFYKDDSGKYDVSDSESDDPESESDSESDSVKLEVDDDCTVILSPSF